MELWAWGTDFGVVIILPFWVVSWSPQCGQLGLARVYVFAYIDVQLDEVNLHLRCNVPYLPG